MNKGLYVKAEVVSPFYVNICYTASPKYLIMTILNLQVLMCRMLQRWAETTTETKLLRHLRGHVIFVTVGSRLAAAAAAA